MSCLRGYCTPNQKIAYWKIIYTSYSKLSKELTNGIESLVGQVVFKLWTKTVKNCVLINNSRTAWPAEILMLFLGSLDNLLQDAYNIFQTGNDNF